MLMRRVVVTLLLAGVVPAVPASLVAQEAFDRAMISRIRDEGLNRSHAWGMLDTIADVIGPRLTASPAFMRAAQFAEDHLRSWVLANVHMESWQFGRGWQLGHYALEMTPPRYTPMIGYPDGQLSM